MIVQLTSVSKKFDNLEVLNDINFTLQKNEIVSLLGPSGCGKSTLLKIISNLESYTSGTVKWENPPRPLDIGVVFQEPTLLPWKSVLENVLLPYFVQNTTSEERTKKTEEAKKLLDWLGLIEFINYKPAQLSGGMKMRVSIARALVTKPQVLLLDEPFAALDESTRFKLQSDFFKLCKQLQTTVVFVTHSVNEACFLSDRIILLSQRPAKIVAQHNISFANVERDMNLRTSQQYMEVIKNVSKDYYSHHSIN